MRPLPRFLKFLSLFTIIGLLFFVIIPTGIQAASTSVTSTPVEDAFVFSSDPDTNYGSSTTLRVDGSPIMRSYVRFDLSTLSGDSITSALLKIYANSSLSEGFSIDQLSDNTWQENTITFNNAPAPESSITQSGDVSSDQWVTIDITSYIKGAGIYDVVFDPLSTTQLSLASRESGSNAPQLIVTQSSSATSTPTRVLNTPTPTSTQKPSTPTPPSSILTVNPNADAYIEKSKSTTNFGTSTSLLVDQAPDTESYLRFDLSSMGFTTVTNATLRIYADSSLDTGFDVDQLSNNTWQENTIDYDNAPTPGPTITQSGQVSANQWVSIDISGYINGPGIYSLVLDPLSTAQLDLASRKSGSYAPQLVLTGSSSGSPVPTTMPTPTQSSTFTPKPTRANTPTSTPTPSNTLTPTPTPTRSNTPTPTGTNISGKVPNFSHVIIMIFENREYSSVVGSSSWVNFNNLAAKYALLTQSYAVDHPSLPNYLALTSGSTQGITSDCTSCFVNATNVADLVENDGKTWKAYMESMPSPCYLGDSGDYAQKHNPFVYYDDIRTNTSRCQNDDVPLTQLDTDLSNNALPAYAWITPNLCHDGHDCSDSTADGFLGYEVSKILVSPSFDQNSLLIITFDEGSSDATCCGLPSSAGGHIATLLISDLVKTGYNDSTPYDHYSILKTIADAWGLPYLAHVSNSSTNSITAPWK